VLICRRPNAILLAVLWAHPARRKAFELTNITWPNHRGGSSRSANFTDQGSRGHLLRSGWRCDRPKTCAKVRLPKIWLDHAERGVSQILTRAGDTKPGALKVGAKWIRRLLFQAIIQALRFSIQSNEFRKRCGCEGKHKVIYSQFLLESCRLENSLIPQMADVDQPIYSVARAPRVLEISLEGTRLRL